MMNNLQAIAEYETCKTIADGCGLTLEISNCKIMVKSNDNFVFGTDDISSIFAFVSGWSRCLDFQEIVIGRGGEVTYSE